MQDMPVHINFISVIIFIGIVLGLILSFFFIKKSYKTKSPNLYMGFLLLALALIMLEGWLNYTRYIFQFLSLTNFSEPLNLAIAPLVYLFNITQLNTKKQKLWWLHFIPMLFWFGYCQFFFSMPDEFKYNDNLRSMGLLLPYLETNVPYSGDPLSIRDYINTTTIIHIVVYLSIIIWQILKVAHRKKEKIFTTKDSTLASLRNSFYHFLIITVILVSVKLIFKNDVGDYMIFLYMTFMILLTTYHIMNSSDYFSNTSTLLEGPIVKYKKSSLVEERKEIIINAILHQLKEEKFHLNSTASLSGLAKSIHHNAHHVSQVINEKLNQTFFEMIAQYRVEEAKAILKSEFGKKLTIEEVAERVGYNSKSAFNTAFKKFTSQTPSKFRDS